MVRKNPLHRSISTSLLGGRSGRPGWTERSWGKKLARCLRGGKPRCGLCPVCLTFQRKSAEKGNEGCGWMAGRLDRRAGVEQAGRDGPRLIKRPDPVPRVRAFSYRLVMPCHRHCPPACPGIYLLPSLVRCFLQKPPERLRTCLSPSHPLCLSLRKAF